jgi:hypothetical protein
MTSSDLSKLLWEAELAALRAEAKAKAAVRKLVRS